MTLSGKMENWECHATPETHLFVTTGPQLHVIGKASDDGFWINEAAVHSSLICYIG